MDVYVSVVEAGKGLISTNTFAGSIIRDPSDDKRWHAEICESDTVDLDTVEDVNGVDRWSKSSRMTLWDVYKRGAAALAALHTDGPYSITVEFEYGPNAWQPRTFPMNGQAAA
jgi:phosphoribosylformimino-5-aminoimidazole carboxamide ribonucleotide (ProFAR) isomerase